MDFKNAFNFHNYALELTSICGWYDQRIHKKIIEKHAKRNVIFPWDLIDSARELISLTKYFIKIASEALNYKETESKSWVHTWDRCLYPMTSPRRHVKKKSILFSEKSHMLWSHVRRTMPPLYIAFATLLRTFHRRISMLTHKILKVEREIKSHIARSFENLLPTRWTIY